MGSPRSAALKEFDRASGFSLSTLNVLDLMLCGEGQKGSHDCGVGPPKCECGRRSAGCSRRKCSIAPASTIMGCCQKIARDARVDRKGGIDDEPRAAP